MFKAAEYFFYSTLAVQITTWLSMNESFIFHIFIFKFLKRFVAGSINYAKRYFYTQFIFLQINILSFQNGTNSYEINYFEVIV